MCLLRNHFVVYMICRVFAKSTVTNEKITYVSAEHPQITYLNTKFVSFVNWTSRRYSRSDPVHYNDFHFKSLVELNDNFTIHLYFLEFLTNEYKLSFVEAHSQPCVMFHLHPVTAPIAKRFLGNYTCPLPAGEYRIKGYALTSCEFGVVRKLLANFPFPKGRLRTEVTYTPTGEFVGKGDIDFEIKQFQLGTKYKCKNNI